MKDAALITRLLQKGREAGETVRKEFASLSLPQLNWKPGPESWSIGQCLDHLIVTDSLYFPTFKKVAGGNYTMTRWQRLSPFSGLFGKILVSSLQPDAKRKTKTVKIFYPSSTHVDAGIIERFQKHLDTLLEYIAGCTETELDKTIVTSPVSGFITYSLRDTVTLLVHHEHRHIRQGIRVKSCAEFPK